MKNKFQKFGIGLFLILQIILWIGIMSFKSPEPPPQSTSKITTVSNGVNAYRLNVDGTQYIVVVNNDGGGVAIIKHR